MKKIILLLVLSLMILTVSCKKDDGLPETIQFSTFNNLPIMNAEINGHKVKLLIDTGASISIIDGNLYEKLEFDIVYGGEDMGVSGIGGTEILLDTRNVRTYHNGEPVYVRFKTSNLKNIRKSIGVVGIIGSDFFLHNKVVIDYKNRVIRNSNMLD